MVVIVVVDVEESLVEAVVAELVAVDVQTSVLRILRTLL